MAKQTKNTNAPEENNQPEKPIQPLIPSQTPDALMKGEGQTEFSVELVKGMKYRVKRVFLTLQDLKALVFNGWNDRDLKADSKVVKAQQASFRQNGWAPTTDPLTGQTKEMVLFWQDNQKLRKVISRGHVRTVAMLFCADEDEAYMNAKVDSAAYKARTAAVEKLQQQFGSEAHYHTAKEIIHGINGERPGIPALLIDGTLSLEEQLALMGDQDTRQAIKSVREQLPSWAWLIGRGDIVGKDGKPNVILSKKQAYDLVCEGKRRIEYENILALYDQGGDSGRKVVTAWLAGKITDAKMDSAVKAMREDAKSAPMAPSEDWAKYQQQVERVLSGETPATELKVTPGMVAEWATAIKDKNRLVLAWLLATQGKQTTASGSDVEPLTGDEIERLKLWALIGVEKPRQPK